MYDIIHLVYDVDVGWERSEPMELCINQTPTSIVSAGANSHEARNFFGWNPNRFRLTETIYMKLKTTPLRVVVFNLLKKKNSLSDSENLFRETKHINIYNYLGEYCESI